MSLGMFWDGCRQCVSKVVTSFPQGGPLPVMPAQWRHIAILFWSPQWVHRVYPRQRKRDGRIMVGKFWSNFLVWTLLFEEALSLLADVPHSSSQLCFQSFPLQTQVRRARLVLLIFLTWHYAYRVFSRFMTWADWEDIYCHNLFCCHSMGTLCGHLVFSRWNWLLPEFLCGQNLGVWRANGSCARAFTK